MGVIPGEEYGLPETPTPPSTIPGEEYGAPPREPTEKDDDDDVPTPPMEEIIPDKDEEPPKPRAQPMEEVIPDKEEEPPVVMVPGEEYGLPSPPPLLEVAELPEGRQWESEPGMIEVTFPEGGQLSFMKTPTGYIQLSGETYETRWEPFIPTTPSKELRKALDEYSRLEGREQFEQAIKIGFIPVGSKYVEVDGDWGYLTPEAIRAAKLAGDVEELERTHLGPLPDGKWIPIEDWNKLDPKYQSIALRQGWGKAQAAWNEDHVRLPDGTWMLRSDVESLKTTMPEGHNVLMSEGFDAYGALFVGVGEDEYMLREDYDTLPDDYKKVVDDKGVTGLQKYLETGILGTTVSRLDEIASPDFFVKDGNVSERIALEGAMRRAGIMYPGVVTYNELSDAEKQRVAENYIAPEGFGIASEAEYELRKLREKIQKWYESDVPVGITTVEQLEELASYDFTKLGWGTSDRIALENTMRRLGIRDPGVSTYRKLNPEEKQRVADNFTYETLAVELLKPVEEWTAKVVEDLTTWVTEDPNIARKIAKGIPAGLVEIILGLTVGVGGAVLKSVNDFVVQRPKSGAAQLSNVPLGAAEWLVVQTPTRIEQDPAAGISLFAGNLVLPFVIPGIRGAVGGVKSGYNIAQTLYRRGVLPRALKGGGLDIYKIRLPVEFKSLTTEQVKAIFQSGLSGREQMARVEALYTPETAAVYLKYMEALDLVKDFRAPASLIRDVDFTIVRGTSLEAAAKLKAYLQKNPDIAIGGSVATYHQSKGVYDALRPNDFDFYIREGSSLKVADVKAQLSEILRDSKLFDVHLEGEFGKLPYDWSPLGPITIEGIKFRSLADGLYRRTKTVTTPGLDESLGLMGPKVEVPLEVRSVWGIDIGTGVRRIKDVSRLHAEYRGIAEALRRKGDVTTANLLHEIVDFVETAPRGEPLPVAGKGGAALREEFIELVRELQESALDRGVDVALEHPLGTLYRYITPQGKVLRGTVYHVTRDTRPFMKTYKEKGYIEAGRYIDEQGRWVEAPRAEAFVSLDAAFDRLYDIFEGKIPKDAGIIAIRTIATDVGRGKTVDPAFRTEYVQEVGKAPYEVVYDELRFVEGNRAYGTAPTGFSFRKGSVSEGLTGEISTYHPRAKVPVNVLFFATEGAKRAGLGAPSAVQIHSMNLMAIKAVIGDLWHPRFPERFVATTEPIRGAGLIEFRRETYKWRDKPKAEVVRALAEQDMVLRMEAVENLRRKGKDGLPPEEYAKALDEELTRVSSKQVLELLSDKEVQRLLKDLTTDEIARTYYYNLKELYSKVAAVGLGGARATDITKMTNADITVLPSLGSRIDGVTLPLPPFVTEEVTPPTVGITEITPLTEGITPLITPVAELTPTTTPEITKLVTTLPTTPLTPVKTVKPATPIKTVTPIESRLRPVSRTFIVPTPEVGEEKRARIPSGSITWRQGFVWRYIPPPWDQPKPLTLMAPPIGATILGRTPSETIQMIGTPTAKVPKEVSVDLGVVDILITDYGEHIEFTGGGLKTIVGERIPVPEKGMSIPQMEPVETGGVGLQGLKLGTSFAEFIRRIPEDEAQKEFMEKRITEMMSEMSTEDIVSEIRSAELPEERVAELLSHMPDSQRGVAERLLTIGALYRRVGPGYQYAETTLAQPKLTEEQRKGLEAEEDKELYTEEELREMEAEGLSHVKPSKPVKSIQPSIVSLKGLRDV